MPKQPAVYILSSKRNGTLYTGVTSNLVARTWQHREHLIEGFTKQHDVTRLVWFEMHEEMASAILREKQIKAWKRQWKIEMIEAMNPGWQDLWQDITGATSIMGSCFRRNDNR